MGSCCVAQGAQSGREVGWGAEEVQEGGNICVLLADSCCCVAETNMIL